MPVPIVSDPPAPTGARRGRVGRRVGRLRGDVGAVDESVPALFGFVVLIGLVLVVIECAAFWHARNLYDEAAAEGARVAAAADGSCAAGEAVARELLDRRGRWASGAVVRCTDTGGSVTVRVSGPTPGIVFGERQLAEVAESAPRER